MRHVFALELADHRAVAALRDIEDRMMDHVVHESNAARAEDAAIGDVDDVAPEVLDGIEPLWLTVASFRPAFLICVVLQLALTRLVADWTIERVIDEQHLEHTLSRLEGFLRVNAHHLPFGDR